VGWFHRLAAHPIGSPQSTPHRLTDDDTDTDTAKPSWALRGLRARALTYIPSLNTSLRRGGAPPPPIAGAASPARARLRTRIHRRRRRCSTSAPPPPPPPPPRGVYKD